MSRYFTPDGPRTMNAARKPADEEFSDTEPNYVPTCDQLTPIATYREWRPEDTVIKTYRIGNEVYPGIFAANRDEARAHCEATFGRVLEANYVLGRAFFRVHRGSK